MSKVIVLSPRKVAKIGGRAAIYLPKPYWNLHGKYVKVTIEILEEFEKGNGDVW